MTFVRGLTVLDLDSLIDLNPLLDVCIFLDIIVRHT